jgi:hypothetical protein
MKKAKDYLKDDLYKIWFYTVLFLTHKMSYNYVMYSSLFWVSIIIRVMISLIAMLYSYQIGWLFGFCFTIVTFYEHYKRKELRKNIEWTRNGFTLY